MQRLFSSFANGWPGRGLLLQRLLTASALFDFGIHAIREMANFASIIPQAIGLVAGALILVGLWTPVVGSLIAAVEMWIALSSAGDTWSPIMLAILGASLAMIGPGAWSIDARLFGREHIEIPKR